MESRYATGGFEPRFIVTRTDGKPCRPGARYMVLDGSGADPHAILAIKIYALSVRSENFRLADDLERMIGETLQGPNQWPSHLAQHGDAE